MWKRHWNRGKGRRGKRRMKGPNGRMHRHW